MIRNWACVALSAFAIFTSRSAMAAPRDEVLTAISRCSNIANDRTFLDCIYGAAQPLRAELGLPPAPSWQVKLVPISPAHNPTGRVAEPVSAKQGGVFDFLLGGGVQTSSQRMASYAFDNRGLFVVTLADGEVWRQLEGDNNLAKWKQPASKYSVTVRSGALGSHNLEVEGEPGLYKVKPVHW